MIHVDLGTARVVFTTRDGGVSSRPYDSLNLGPFTGDDPFAVIENTRVLGRDLGVGEIHRAHQVHRGEMAMIGAGTASSNAPELPAADGLLTTSVGSGLLITGADCPTVALAGENKLALLHCGWRPLALGIIERALTEFDRPPSAVIGPGIGAMHYVVKEEVPRALGDDANLAYRDGHLDLRMVIRTKLARHGVGAITDIDRCTYGEAKTFFSHRREGPDTGRQAGIAWLS